MVDSAEHSSGEGQGHEISEEGNRSMGFATASAIGIGTMIAAGIFVLSGLAVSKVGTAAIASFLLAAVVASLTAASYAEFASVYPESGGGYVYVARTIPSELTYMMGWTMILGYPASAAFYLGSFSKWFYEFLYDPLSVPGLVPYWVSGGIILALLVGLNIAGAEEAGKFQIVVTTLKVLLIAVFLYGAFQAFDASVVMNSFQRNIADFADIGVTSALVFITFFGFSAIATDAEEIKDPGDTIPKAIYFSMAFVSVVYALVVIAIVLAVNDQTGFLPFLANQVDLGGMAPARYVANHGELAMGLAAEFYLGRIGFFVIIAGALVSMLSAANATILAGSRVKLALARNGHLPPSFADVHDRWETPYKSVVLTGVIIAVLLAIFTVVFFHVPGATDPSAPLLGISLGLEALANFANVLLIVGLSIVNLALIQSRRRFPDAERGFEVPFVPWVPALAVVGNAILLANIVYRHPVIVVIALLAELVGVGVWFLVKDREPDEEHFEEETPTAVSEHHETDHDYQLVVPVANEANVEQLMRTATDVVSDRDAELLVLNVAEVPSQTPYSEAEELAEQRRDVVNRAMDIADEAGVPVSGSIRIGHDSSAAILNTVRQYDSDGVLLGWGGDRSSISDIALGTTVDDVVTEADADVFVENVGESGGSEDVESVLLPWADSAHADLAADLAADIAESTGASIDVVRVVGDGDDEDREDAEELLTDAEAHFDGDVDVQTRVVEGDDVSETLAEEAKNHDVTTLGSESEGILQKLVFGAVPESVGDRVENTVIMCQRKVGPRSRLERLFQ